MLDTIELGLGESQQLKAVGLGTGTFMAGTEGMCRGIEAALVREGVGELVDDSMLQATLRSIIAPSAGAAEI
jgi:hypothetical protein